MEQIRFRAGTAEDLDEIFGFVKAAIEKMILQDIPQWDEIYPTRDDFAADIESGNLYVGELDGRLVCVYVLSKDCDEEYNNAQWKTDTDNFIVLHRIVVNPDFQNQGIGRLTMEHIIDSLMEQKVQSLRLDVFSLNPYSQRLYDKLGFVRTGQANWRKGLFYLMEKVLPTN